MPRPHVRPRRSHPRRRRQQSHPRRRRRRRRRSQGGDECVAWHARHAWDETRHEDAFRLRAEENAVTLFSRSFRPAWRSAAAMIVSVVAVLALPTLLFAHARLTKSTPSANERVLNSPDAVRLWFSEAPELAFTKTTLLAADSSEIKLGTVQRIPGERLGVSATVGAPLGAGTYTVVWQVAAADGHPSRGHFRFTVLPGAAPATTIPQ